MATEFQISKSAVFSVCLLIVTISDQTSGQDPFALRLANGGGSSHAGRVEVFSDGEWGTVCDPDWTYADAKVVCYQLGFGGPIAALGSAHFGPGSGDIVLRNPACEGEEFKLNDCQSTNANNCDHNDDVGVICSGNSTNQPAPYTVRLVDNHYSFKDGRVEVYLDGAWGTICGDSWDDTAATLVCNWLGFSYSGTLYGSADSMARFKVRDPVLYDVSCNGSETNLSQCAMTTVPRDCAVGDATVSCLAIVINGPDDFEVRLVDRVLPLLGPPGPSSYLTGRVEVFVNGTWRRLCNNEVTDTIATVVCRQLDYGLATATTHTKTFGATVKINLHCNGLERSLKTCQLTESHACDNGETGDGGVICSGSDEPELIVRLTDGSVYLEGRVEIYAGGEWGKVCSDGFSVSDGEVVCRQLGYGEAVSVRTFGSGPGDTIIDSLLCTATDANLHECYKPSGERCEEDDPGAGVACNNIRLVGGDTGMAGTVEVYNDGQWDSVCGDGWNLSDATVVCRQLGKLRGSGDYRATAYYANARFGAGSGQRVMSEVGCEGTEDLLFDCPHSDFYETGCPHWKDAGVECTSTSTTIENYSVRLFDGDSASEGRVEFYSGDQWYTVCADGWDTVASLVVCRQLGFAGASIYNSVLSYGNGTGRPIGGVKCYGEDEDLSECVVSWEGCANSKEAAVECSSKQSPVALGSIRLLDGPSEIQGRVEVFYDFQWGTICDEEWSDLDATVVCGELGFTGYIGKAVKGGYFTAGSNLVFLSNVRCVGNEERLVYCDHDGWRDNDCNHIRDAGVICTLPSPDEPAVGSIRLLDGPSDKQGRVEVYYDFQWGTICDEGWSDDDATVVCRELGFANYIGKAVEGGYFKPGHNFVFLSNVRCVGNEERLMYCNHEGWRNNNCNHNRDAGVICTLPDDPGGDNGDRGGLSAGAIAGLCVGSLAVLAGVLVVLGLILYRKRDSSKGTFDTQQPSCPTVYYSPSVVNPPCPIADSPPPKYTSVKEQTSNFPQVTNNDLAYETPDSTVAV